MALKKSANRQIQLDKIPLAMVEFNFNEICQTDLKLTVAEQKKLKSKAKNCQSNWDIANCNSSSRNKNGVYSSEVQSQIALSFLESGWQWAESRLSPGRSFWPDSATHQGNTKLSYSTDKSK